MTITTKLVGVRFREMAVRDIVKGLPEGQELVLRADFENPYDENAIAVDLETPKDEENIHLGFIPKDDNFEIAEHFRAGGYANATILSFMNPITPWLEVYLHDGPA